MDLKTLRTTDQQWEIALLSGPNTSSRHQPADGFEREKRRRTALRRRIRSETDRLRALIDRRST